MVLRQLHTNWIGLGGKRIDQMKYIRQIAPEYFFFQRAEAEWCETSLLNSPGVIAGL